MFEMAVGTCTSAISTTPTTINHHHHHSLHQYQLPNVKSCPPDVFKPPISSLTCFRGAPPCPSSPPSPLHPPAIPRRHESPIPSNTRLAPLLTHPQITKLPPPSTLPCPPLPRPTPKIPSVKPLYQTLLTDPPPPPFPSNPADGDLLTQSTQCRVCQHPAMKTCLCTLIPLSMMCVPPESHAAFCARHKALIKLIKAREDHPCRLELVTMLRAIYKNEGFLSGLQLAV